jgi:hypothetical protein
MRSRDAGFLSIATVAALLLVGCTQTSTPEPTTTAATEDIVESSLDQPAVAGERVGADGLALEVWSSTVPDESAAGALGDPEAGSQWVTVNVAQWVSDEGLSDVDVAPVLHSAGDESFTGTAVSPRSVEVPMTPEKSYTFVWSFQVPEALVDGSSLVLCVREGDSGCSAITAG